MTFEGGVGVFIKNLINYQLMQNYDVGIAFVDNPNCNVDLFLKSLVRPVNVYPIERISFKGANLLFGIPIKGLYNKLKKENPSMNIIFHEHDMGAIGFFNNVKSVPLISTIHIINMGSHLSSFLNNLILKRYVRQNKKLIYVSSYVKNYFDNIILSKNANVIWNGIPNPDLNRKPKLSPDNKFTIGFVGRISEQKGWRYLYEAYKLLPEEYKSKIQIFFVGNGSGFEELNQLIKSDNLSDSVSSISFVENASDNIFPLLDLYAAPSKNEGFGLTIIEAYAHRVPVIATCSGGIAEIVVDGKTGVFIKRKAEDIADKIIHLYNNKRLLDEISENAYKLFVENFTLEVMGRKYDSQYRDIIQGVKYEYYC
jgi:glycosyltransferase involved in cell wall biosynthesis